MSYDIENDTGVPEIEIAVRTIMPLAEALTAHFGLGVLLSALASVQNSMAVLHLGEEAAASALRHQLSELPMLAARIAGERPGRA